MQGTWGDNVQFSFGDYALDVDRRELTHGYEQISLTPQVFDLLVYLVRNRQRVVSKDDLIEGVWGGRIVSESTLTSHINAVRKAVGDSGEEQRFIRTIARKGFHFVGDVREPQTSVSNHSRNLAPSANSDELLKHAPATALPDKPSIAVLPFQNMSGDPEQDYFADGVVEEIITALSRIRSLLVIARNSSFTYKGRAVDIKQVGRELGVRYVLEGSVRKSENRVRVAGKLIDASTGVGLWADRFEGALEDIFRLQDQVTTSVIGAVAPKLEHAEIECAKRKPTESLDAYDYYLRGVSNVYLRTKEATDEALTQFYKAIELDPSYSAAYGMAGWCYMWRKINGWMIDQKSETVEATRLARRAIELGKDDAVALARGAQCLALGIHDLDGAVAAHDRALKLNPNLATTWFMSGWIRTYCGEPELALEHHARAMQLSPLDPTLYHMQAGTAFAHFVAGRYDDASRWAELAFNDQPNYVPAAVIAAASHALAGRMEEARHAMERLRQINPVLRFSNLKDWWAFRRPDDFARWADGLHKAGLPE